MAISTQTHRLDNGGLIDRSQAARLHLRRQGDGGFAGDTLASALVANGVKLVGRSFKYHRPRGILTAGSEEPNALVELRSGARREPNTKAHHAELYDGLVAASQNRWPSLRLRSSVHQPVSVADLRRRLLLQDLHVAREVVGVALRAADPPRRGAGTGGRSCRSRPLREGLGALRRAGGRRWPSRTGGGARGRPRRRAGDPVRGRQLPRRTAAQRRRRNRRHARCRLDRADDRRTRRHA